MGNSIEEKIVDFLNSFSTQKINNITLDDLLYIVLKRVLKIPPDESLVTSASRIIQDNYLKTPVSYKLCIEEFKKINGIGSSTAFYLSLLMELSRRLNCIRGTAIKNVRDVMPFIRYISEKKQEYFLALSLNSGNRVLSNRVVSIGLVDKALVHPREVFSDAIKLRASRVIVAHNHPAELLEPSEEDLKITENLVRAGSILGIELLDHIIITTAGYYSFRENSLI